MREILFRGLRTDGKGWVEGDLLTGIGTYKKGRFYILPVVNNLASIPGCHPLDGLEVIPESVGQFTGLTDRNGTKIFDGDICKTDSKFGFNGELMEEFRRIKELDCINGIANHFTGIVRLDFQRGLMFESMENGYSEPMFTRHMEIKRNHSDLEVIGNIHENR